MKFPGTFVDDSIADYNATDDRIRTDSGHQRCCRDGHSSCTDRRRAYTNLDADSVSEYPKTLDSIDYACAT